MLNQHSASYWYEYDDKYAILASKKMEMEKNLKLKEKKNKHSEDEEEEEEDDDDDEEAAKKKRNKQIKQEDTSDSHECDTVNLAKTIMQLSAKIKEESFLLVNSTNWEENIIFDMSHANLNELSLNSQLKSNSSSSSNINLNNEMINERIKNAGWIPSLEHRTLSSFQSKILGKKVDFINNYRDQAVPSLVASAATTKSSASNVSSSTIMNNWNSIFPNQNYDLIFGNWENKIILDTENLDISKINPPEFCLDLNDDNLLLGLPDDANSLEELRHKEETVTAEGGTKKGDKVKIYESRNKMSKNLLGKTGLIGKDDTNDENNNEVKKFNMLSPSKMFYHFSFMRNYVV